MGTEEDDHGSQQANSRPEYVPKVRPHPFDEPEPDDGRKDVDAAVGGISPARGGGIDAREAKGEDDKGKRSGDGPERAFLKAKPGPEGEAAADFAEGGEGVPGEGLHEDL